MSYFTRGNVIKPEYIQQTGRLKNTKKIAGGYWFKPVKVLRPYKDAASGWTAKSKRIGLLATKVGMMTSIDEWGRGWPVTVLSVNDCYVTQVKRFAVAGYNAIQVGAGAKKLKRLKKPQRGHLAAAGVPPVKKLTEFRVTRNAVVPLGTKLYAMHFLPGQKVDVTGISRGKGFEGAMKRWGFSGLPASHGVSLTHRSIGATGARQDPGKVWKGKKMAGRRGHEQITTLSLKVFAIDTAMNCLLVIGSVPGPRGGLIKVRDAVGYKFETVPPFPTYFPKRHGQKPGVIADSLLRATTKKPTVYEEGEEMIPGSKEYKNYIETAYPLRPSEDLLRKLEAIKVIYRNRILTGTVAPIIREEFPHWLPTEEEKAISDKANQQHRDKENAKKLERVAKFIPRPKKTHLMDASLQTATTVSSAKDKLEKAKKDLEEKVATIAPAKKQKGAQKHK